jgi:hypothetical protein
MKIGTKSLLFGCHQVFWHPWTVALAYRKLYRQWPDAAGWLCILVHDWGYWNCTDIDGKEGKLHPMLGARIVGRVVRFLHRIRGHAPLQCSLFACDSALRCVLHSGTVARDNNEAPSDICHADKYSIFCEWEWFYLLRTFLSGELHEFIQNAVMSGHVPEDCTGVEWLRWFKGSLLKRPEIHDLLQDSSPVRRHYLLRYSPRMIKLWASQFEKASRNPPVSPGADVHLR